METTQRVSVDEWINKTGKIQTVEYYLAIKDNVAAPAGMAHLVGASSHKPTGCRFSSRSGHIQEAEDRCFSPSLPPLLPSLKPVSKSSGED